MTDESDLRGPWPWRWDPAQHFNVAAGHARISAGFPIGLYAVETAEYDVHPERVGRDLALLIVMAVRRAERVGAPLDLDAVTTLAREELERLERRDAGGGEKPTE